ncbi:unnamed protein product [Lactuca virosa]|uniref:Uncharacterized protein n=1 Tax=Lactuca virosa TaxID=75947 RepID=A0AAU9MZQ0_9ASTR|nr:unnamed protein product [Lactuca virosa]
MPGIDCPFFSPTEQITPTVAFVFHPCVWFDCFTLFVEDEEESRKVVFRSLKLEDLYILNTSGPLIMERKMDHLVGFLVDFNIKLTKNAYSKS